MTRNTTIGILSSILIGGVMAAGVTLASGIARADTQQDYTYLQVLETNGFHVTNPAVAKSNAQIICSQLASGRHWKLVFTDLMTGSDSDLHSAAIQFAAAITVYCPALDPFAEGGMA